MEPADLNTTHGRKLPPKITQQDKIALMEQFREKRNEKLAARLQSRAHAGTKVNLTASILGVREIVKSKNEDKVTVSSLNKVDKEVTSLSEGKGSVSVSSVTKEKITQKDTEKNQGGKRVSVFDRLFESSKKPSRDIKKEEETEVIKNKIKPTVRMSVLSKPKQTSNTGTTSQLGMKKKISTSTLRDKTVRLLKEAKGTPIKKTNWEVTDCDHVRSDESKNDSQEPVETKTPENKYVETELMQKEDVQDVKSKEDVQNVEFKEDVQYVKPKEDVIYLKSQKDVQEFVRKEEIVPLPTKESVPSALIVMENLPSEIITEESKPTELVTKDITSDMIIKENKPLEIITSEMAIDDDISSKLTVKEESNPEINAKENATPEIILQENIAKENTTEIIPEDIPADNPAPISPIISKPIEDSSHTKESHNIPQVQSSSPSNKSDVISMVEATEEMVVVQGENEQLKATQPQEVINQPLQSEPTFTFGFPDVQNMENSIEDTKNFDNSTKSQVNEPLILNTDVLSAMTTHTAMVCSGKQFDFAMDTTQVTDEEYADENINIHMKEESLGQHVCEPQVLASAIVKTELAEFDHLDELDNTLEEDKNNTGKSESNQTKLQKSKIPVIEVKPVRREKKEVVKVSKPSEKVKSKPEVQTEQKKGKPLRRSISMIHHQKSGSKNSAVHIAESVLQEIPLEELYGMEPRRLSTVHESLEEFNKEETERMQNRRRRSRSVSFITPKKESPSFENLKDYLEKWLSANGKSISEFKHLNSFGPTTSLKPLPTPLRPRVKLTPARRRSSDFNETGSPDASMYATAPCTPAEESDKENMTPPTAVQQAGLEETKEWLMDIHKLITELRYPYEQCDMWLTAIRRLCGQCVQLPVYWECLAALEESRGDMNSAIEFYERAIIKGAEVESVIGSLSHLFEKFVTVEPKKETKSTMMKQVDPKNIFTSTIIKFALQQKAVKKLSNELGIEAKQLNYVVTPVRRSARTLKSPGPNLISSMQSLESLTPDLRRSIKFKSNASLLTGD